MMVISTYRFGDHTIVVSPGILLNQIATIKRLLSLPSIGVNPKAKVPFSEIHSLFSLANNLDPKPICAATSNPLNPNAAINIRLSNEAVELLAIYSLDDGSISEGIFKRKWERVY